MAANENTSAVGSVEKVPFLEKIAYGLGDAGCNFIWTTVGMFLTVYYTDNVGIAAGVVGTIMLLTRLLDGISDLIMGNIVDHTHTRWGKARPWVGLMAPFMGIGLVLLFNVPGGLSGSGKIVYAFITYILLAVVIFTACNLSYGTMMSFMAPDQQDRTTLSSVRFFCTWIAVLIIIYTAPGMIASIGYRWMSVIYGIAGTVLILITFFFCKERTIGESVENKREDIPVKQALVLLFKNKYFIFVALLFIINYAALNLTNGIAIYYIRDILGNMGAYGTVNTMGFLPSIILLPVFPKIVEKTGKWKCLMIGFIMQIIGYLVILATSGSFAMLLIGLALVGVGRVPHSAGMFAMIADVIDYGDWKFGKRVEGMTYSAASFGMKVGTGLGSAVVGWGLAIGGYSGEAAVQSASALFAIKALYTWVPLILIVIGTVILAMCNLDKIYPTIVKELAERKTRKA
ncbi:MAG: MFS transporter [Lachnospiraceae bacterium]|nr:MFS transporter [Lachnospiraceae bacterium]